MTTRRKLQERIDLKTAQLYRLHKRLRTATDERTRAYIRRKIGLTHAERDALTDELSEATAHERHNH